MISRTQRFSSADLAGLVCTAVLERRISLLAGEALSLVVSATDERESVVHCPGYL
jgi:hypothetical protein